MKTEVLKLVIHDLENLTSHLKDLLVNDVEEKPREREEPFKKIGLEDVRAVLVKLSQYGKTAEVKELITKYGGIKLSDID